MKNYLQFILERSSLTQLGVPNPVMQHLQKDYVLDDDATWTEYTRKIDIKDELTKDQNSMFIQVDTTFKIKVFLSIVTDDEKTYMLDEYKLDSRKDWGGEWEKKDREILSISSLMGYINIRDGKVYKLDDDNFSITPYKKRKEIEVQNEFNEFTEFFKKHIIDNFSQIIRNIFGQRAEAEVKDKIIDNISNIKSDMSLDEIKRILLGQVGNIEREKSKSIPEDPLNLKDTTIKDNSLTVFDEYLLGFEDAYSDELGEFVFVEDLVRQYTMSKVVRAFIYYMYNGRLINL